MLADLRNTLAYHLTRIGRRVATDPGWSAICAGLGAPGMLSGLMHLRERGFSPAVVVDCGACVGDWSRLLLRIFPRAKVLMVEPQQRHAAALRALCASHAPALQLATSLVGPPDMDSADFVVLDDKGAGTGSSVLAENSQVPRHVVRLPVVTLDALVAQHGLAAPDLIKLDVQGFEIEVLKGASAALASASFMLLEVSLVPYNQGSPLLAEVVAWMDGHGWRVHDVFDLTRRADGVMLQADLLFVRKDSPFDVRLAAFVAG